MRKQFATMRKTGIRLFFFLLFFTAMPSFIYGVTFTLKLKPECGTSGDGKITVKISTGTPNYTYELWDTIPYLLPANPHRLQRVLSTPVDSAVFSGLVTRNYWVYVMDGSSGTWQKITLTRNPSLSGSTISVTKGLTCSYSTDAILKANPVGGTAPYTYKWSASAGNQTTQSATNIGQGTHTVTITDAATCSVSPTIFFFYGANDSVPADIVIDPDPVATTATCTGLSQGSVTMAAAGGTGTLSYSITAGGASGYQASPVFTNLAAGSYEVWVKDIRGCKAQGSNATVAANPLPVATAASNSPVCVGEPLSLLGGPAAMTTYAWSGPLSYSSGIQNPVVSPAATLGMAGVYTLIVTDGNGCKDTITTTATINNPPTITLGANPTVCRGTTSTNLTYSATTGAPDKYSIDFDATANGAGFLDLTNAGLPASPITITVPGAAAAATYNAVLTVSNSGTTCTSVSYPITVTINPAPTITLGANPGVCRGTTTANLTYSATTGTPNQYSIDFDATANLAGFADVVNAALPASPIVITVPGAAAAATYNAVLTVRNSGTTCSSVSYPITVTVNAIPTITLGANPSVCRGTTTASLTYSATSGTPNQYSIDFDAAANLAGFTDVVNAVLPASPIVINVPGAMATGTYNAVLTVRNSGTTCSSISYPITITVNPIPTITLGANPTVCQGTTTANLTYSATTGTPNQYSIDFDATANLAGFADVVNAALPASPIVITVPGAAAAATYNAVLTVRNSGTTCSSISYPITVTVSPIPAITLGANPGVCQGTTTANLTYSSTTGTPNQYSIDFDGVANTAGFTDITNAALPASPIVITVPGAAAAATYNAVLTVRNSGTTCSSISYPITVTVNPNPTINLGANPIVCQGTTSANLTYSATSGTPNQYSIDFNAAANLAGFADVVNAVLPASPIVITVPGGAAAATYNAVLTVRNSGTTCSSISYPITVTVNPNPTITLGTSPAVCRGITTANLTYSATTASPDQYSIDFDATANLAGFTDVVNAALPVSPIVITVPGAAAAATYNAILTVRTSGTTCGSVSYPITVKVNALPVATAGNNGPVCEGSALSLTGGPNGMSLYSWTGPAGFTSAAQSPSVSATATLAMAGSYTLNVTDANGCTSNASTTVSITALPVITAGSDASICENSSYTIPDASASGATSLSWTHNGNGSLTDAATISPTYTPAAADANQTVTLTLTALNGTCSITDQMDILVDGAPVVDAGSDATICNGTDFLASGANVVNATGGVMWSSNGDGIFDNSLLLNATYTPGGNDLINGTVTLYLDAFGSGACVFVRDSLLLTIPAELKASVGAPAPFIIGASTQIQVSLKTSGHKPVQDLGIYLVAPDGLTRMPLHLSPMSWNFGINCNFASKDFDVKFTTTATDTLNICAASWKVPLNKLISGTFKPSGAWSDIYGFNPAAGGWSIEVRDYANTHGGVDGAITSAAITFTDLNFQGKMTTVTYTSGVIADSIYEPVTPSYQTTSYQVPLALYTSCYNTCDAQGIVNITGGVGPYTLDWVDPSVPDKDTVFLCRGTFDLNVTDAMGCSTSTSVEVLSPPAILYDSVVFTPAVACNSDLTGSVKVYAHGGVGTLSYSIDGGASFQASGIFSGLGAGTKNIVVKDFNECTIDTSVIITEPAALSASVSKQDVLCNGANTGELHITASGGSLPYSYSYNGGTSFTLSKDTIGLSPGSYSLRVRDAHGCLFDAGSQTIAESAAIVIDSVQLLQTIRCYSDSAMLIIHARGGVGPFAYSLDGGLTQQADSLFSRVGPGTWHPAVTDQNGCTFTGDSLVFVNPAELQIQSVDSSNVTCHGANDGTITITATGGTGTLEYSIDGGSSYFKNGGLFTTLDAGSYSIMVRDSVGCSQTGPDLVITEPDGLNSYDLSYQNISCTGMTDGEIRVSPVGGQAPYTYFLEKDGAPSDTLTDNGDGIFTGLGAGDYKVIITDVNSCATLQTPEFPILEPAPIAIDSVRGTDPACAFTATGSVLIYASGGTAYPSGRAFDFTVDGGQNWDTIQYTTLTAGAWYSGVRDARGCVVLSDTVTLTDPPSPGLDSSNTAAVTGCWYNTNGAVSFWASGGSEPLQYSVGGAFQDTGIFVDVSAGSHILQVQDANGCIFNLDTITVSSPAPIVPVINTTDVTGDVKGTITVFASGGTPPLEFSIDGTNFVPIGSSFGDLEVGSYTITIRDGIGCSLDSTVLINSTCTIQTTVTPTSPSCHGLDDGMLIITAANGTEPYEYSIDCGANYSPSGIYTGLPADIYCIAVKDGGGQVCLTNFELTEPDAVSTIASTNKANCDFIEAGQTDVGFIDLTVLGGSGTFSFVWTNAGGDTISTDEDISQLSAGVYTVSIADLNGCSSSHTYTVDSDPAKAVTLNLAEDTVRLCTGELLDVDGTNASATQYSWFSMPDSSLVDQDAILNLEADSSRWYLLQGVNDYFCANFDSLVVIVWPLPELQLPADTVLLGNLSIQLPLQVLNDTLISDPVFSWDPVSDLDNGSLQNPLFTPTDKGVNAYPYVVTVTSDKGCEQQDTITVNVLWNLSFPSGFTPNDDGINDTWVIPAADAVPVSVDVYNRWGEHVYSAKRYHNDWDGSFNGKPLSIGTYYYIVTIQVGKTKKTFSGPLTIVIQPEK
ncbi:MAG: gliding motility-associated C-terminal domain-containing protein [Bacteroidales bacterium]